MFAPPTWRDLSEDAFERQDGICARCGKELCYENYQKGDKGAWNGHHVNGCPWDDRLTNCAALCINDPENCHLDAHYGNTNLKRTDGSDCVKTRPRSWYRYWEYDENDDIWNEAPDDGGF